MTEPPVSTAFDVKNPYLGGWLDKQSIELAGNVSQTTVDNLQDTLSEGIQAGESVPDLRGRVQGTFQDAGRVRANMIARTEANKAANGAGWVQAQNSGVVKTKTWLATMDDRTRPAHAAMNGETVPVDEAFSNGSMFPDDIQCRCTLTYGIDESKITEPGQDKPLEPIEVRSFSDVDEADDWAREAYRDWRDALDASESSAIYSYGEFAYKPTNNYLRGIYRDISDADKRHIKNIDDALERGALTDNLRVYRGVEDMDEWDAVFKAGDPKSLIGQGFGDNAFVSASLNPSLARKFAGDDGIVLVVDAPKGTPAGYVELETQKGEYEMLLGRDRKFVITNAFVNKAGKRNIIVQVLED